MEATRRKLLLLTALKICSWQLNAQLGRISFGQRIRTNKKRPAAVASEVVPETSEVGAGDGGENVSDGRCWIIARKFKQLSNNGTLPEEAMKALEKTEADKAGRGGRGHREALAQLINSLFTESDSGKLAIDKNSAIFVNETTHETEK